MEAEAVGKSLSVADVAITSEVWGESRSGGEKIDLVSSFVLGETIVEDDG